MGDIFEGLDLEDLANSESPILDGDKFGAMEAQTSTEKAVQAVTKMESKEDPDAVDFDALANLDNIDVIPTGIEDSQNSKEEDSKGDNKTSQTPAPNPKGQSPSSHDAFTSFASVLKDAGVFSSLEEDDLGDIKDTEGLLKAIEKQIKANEYGKLNAEQRKYLEALEVGVPEPEVLQSQSNASQYKKLSEEQIETSIPLQHELIKRSFLIKGFDNKAAEKYASLAVQSEAGVEDAIQAKLALVAHEESKIQTQVTTLREQKQAALVKEQEALLSLKSKINETSEVLPGIQVNATTKDKIFNSITSPVKVDEGNPLNEVMDKYKSDPEYKLKLHALHVITKGFTDFSKFEKTSKTKMTREFEDIIKSTGSGITGTASRRSGDGGSLDGMTSRDIAESLRQINF